MIDNTKCLKKFKKKFICSNKIPSECKYELTDLGVNRCGSRGSSELYVVYGSYLHADGDLLHYNYILCHCQVNIPIFSKETKEKKRKRNHKIKHGFLYAS